MPILVPSDISRVSSNFSFLERETSGIVFRFSIEKGPSYKQKRASVVLLILFSLEWKRTLYNYKHKRWKPVSNNPKNDQWSILGLQVEIWYFCLWQESHTKVSWYQNTSTMRPMWQMKKACTTKQNPNQANARKQQQKRTTNYSLRS